MNLMDPGCFIKLLNNPAHFSAVSFEEWRISGSNRPPQTCHACALPDELIPQKELQIYTIRTILNRPLLNILEHKYGYGNSPPNSRISVHQKEGSECADQWLYPRHA